MILSQLSSDVNEDHKYSDVFEEHNVLQSEQIKSKSEYDDNLWGLESRVKFQKLTHDQINVLKKLITNSGMNLNEIGAKYCVSYSVLQRIKLLTNNQINDISTRRIKKLYGSKREEVIMLINKYLQENTHTITSKEIAAHVNQILQSDYDANFIRKIMKDQLMLRFKRIKQRPNNIDLYKVKLIRRLFALRFAKVVSEKTLIVNIDESSINRGISTKYSWGIKGIPIECRNSPFSGSISLVMAICSNGAWISFVLNETINSDNFIWFLKILHQWLSSHNNFDYSDVILMLDNWAFHKSSISKTFILNLGYTTIYLPAYSPDFAPIEMWFSLIKRNLSSSCKKEAIRISLKHNYNKIYSSLSTIKSSIIRKMFGNLYRNINEYL